MDNIEKNEQESQIEKEESKIGISSETAYNSTTNIQPGLFPVEILQTKKISKATAQSPFYAQGSDGVSYVAKPARGIDNAIKEEVERRNIPCKIISAMTPAAEILGTEIARYCGLAVPEYNILIDIETRELFFGSCVEYAHQHGGVPPERLLSFITGGTPGEADVVCKQLWATHGIDCFLLNIDRHLGNYLYINSEIFGNSYIMPFDFGLSSLAIDGWPKNDTHLSELSQLTCNSNKNWRYITHVLREGHPRYGLYEQNYKRHAANMLLRLNEMNKDQFSSLLHKIPEQWLAAKEKQTLAEWWDSPHKEIRIQKIIDEQLT